MMDIFNDIPCLILPAINRLIVPVDLHSKLTRDLHLILTHPERRIMA